MNNLKESLEWAVNVKESEKLAQDIKDIEDTFAEFDQLLAGAQQRSEILLETLRSIPPREFVPTITLCLLSTIAFGIMIGQHMYEEDIKEIVNAQDSTNPR